MKENIYVSLSYFPIIIPLLYFIVKSIVTGREFPDLYFYITCWIIVLFNFFIPMISSKDNKYVTTIRYLANGIYMFYIVLLIKN